MLHFVRGIRHKAGFLNLGYLSPRGYVKSCKGNAKTYRVMQIMVLGLRKKFYGHAGRDSGNNFRFPDFGLHTGRFRIIFVRISSVVSFRVDIRQLSLF